VIARHKHIWYRRRISSRNIEHCISCPARRKRSLASGRWVIDIPETPKEKYTRLMQENKTTKYKNKRCRCNLGHIHASRGEAGHCNSLQVQERARLIYAFKSQKSFILKVNGRIIGRHIVDFLITRMDGTQEIQEYKGFETEIWKWKRALTEVLYPHINYVVIKHK